LAMIDPRKELIEKLEKIRANHIAHLLPSEVFALREAIETLKSQWDKIDHTPHNGSHAGGAW